MLCSLWSSQLKSESESCLVVSDSAIPIHLLCSPWNSPGQNTGVGSCSLLQGIFSTQGSNPGIPHCRQILYQLSHQGSPRILEPIPSPGDLPNPGIESGFPALQADSYQLSYQGSPGAVNYLTKIIHSCEYILECQSPSYGISVSLKEKKLNIFYFNSI